MPMPITPAAIEKFERRRLRLIELRDILCDGRNSSLAKLLGKSDSYVTRMLWPQERDGRRNIGEDVVKQIEAALGIAGGTLDSNLPVAQALRLKQSDIPHDDPVTAIFHARKGAETTGNKIYPEEATAAIQRLPVLEWAQITGNKKRMHNDAKTWMTAAYEVDPGSYYLPVRGGAMLNPAGGPSFSEGDLILVEPRHEAASGSLVIVMLPGDGEPVFRQLLIDGSKRYLQALNPQWPDRVMAMPDGAAVLGVVTSKTVRY